MAETLTPITIVFKTNSERAYFFAKPEQARQIAADFLHSQYQDGPHGGTYDVQDGDGQARSLALRFADVLYIG